MKTIFDQLTIKHIQIEEQTQRASLEVKFFQNGEYVETTLVLDGTDLNLLFAKLNAKGIEVSLSEDFNCYPTEEGMIYTLDLRSHGTDVIALDHFTPIHDVREVRA
tara:strand:+ start:8814 stop:9131 length:318 start_codon:yes stop_codon:yes gene_type:complete